MKRNIRYDLQGMSNVGEGIKRIHDQVPERCLTLPEFGEYSIDECKTKHYDRMIEKCCESRGGVRK